MRLNSFRHLVLLASAAAAVAAPTLSGAVRPEPAGSDRMIQPVWTPLGVGGKPITVVLEMQGDPVAVQQGNAGRKLERSEKDQIKAQLRGAQASLHGQIQGLGGTVLANYQSAYNGIKVRINARPAVRAGRAAGRDRGAAGVADQAQQRARHSADRRARRMAKPGHPRRGREGRHHRHRHRLHACQFRRPGHSRGIQRGARGGNRSAQTRRCSVPRHRASRAASTWSATVTTPTRIATPTSRFRIRTRIRSTAATSAMARTSPEPPRVRASWPMARPIPARTTPPRSAATVGPSDRASRRRPTSTRSGFSAARVRPMWWSTRSNGRSTTTWTSSTCRSARRSAARIRPTQWPPPTQPRPASWSSFRPATRGRTSTSSVPRAVPMAPSR